MVTLFKRNSFFLLCVIGFLSLLFYHVLSINSPILIFVDAFTADYALHGYFKLWSDFLPPELLSVSFNFGYGTYPVLFGLFRFIYEIFGFGIWQSKIISMLGALSSIVIIFYILRKLQFDYRVQLLSLCFGFSWAFYAVTHSLRYEGPLLLIFTSNIYWMLFISNPFLSMFFGLISGLSFGIGLPNLILFGAMPIMVLFKDGKNFWKEKRYHYWILGSIVGVLIFLGIIDMENAIESHKRYFSGPSNTQIPVLYYFFDFYSLLKRSFFLLLPDQWAQNLFSIPFLSIMIGSSFLLGRRMKEISKPEKLVFGVFISFYVSLSLISASETIQYQIYVTPWAWVISLIAWAKIGKKEIMVDKFDVFMVSAFSFYLITSELFSKSASQIMDCIILSLSIRFIVGSIQIRNIPQKIAVLVLIITIFFNFPSLIEYYQLFHFFFNKKLLMLLCILIFPWLLFRIDNDGPRLRKINISGNTIMLCLFLTVFIGNLSAEVIAVSRKMRSVTSGPELISSFGIKDKSEPIIGPAVLWLYEPTLNIKAVEAISIAKSLNPQIEILPLFLKSERNYMYFPKVYLDLFKDELVDSNSVFSEVVKGNPFETPIGTYIKFERKFTNERKN